MAELSIRKLNKAYGNSLVLSDLNLEIADGELLVMLGPSGSGKTTLLRIIAGLTDPDSGSLTMEGQEICGLPPARREVAMVFQDYALYPNQTAYGNIAFPLRARRWSKLEIDNRVQMISKRLDIQSVLDRKPDQLSGGQQQRLALARALARESKILLMDEPLSNVDARLRDRLRLLIKEIQQELHLTILYVTHDQQEAMLLGDRIAVIEAGRLMQVGTPKDVYANPANRSVASFFGVPPINWIQAQVAHGKAEVGGQKVEIAQSQGSVEIGFRSEHLKLERQSKMDLCFPSVVIDQHYLGSQSMLELHCENRNLVLTCNSADPIPATGSTIEVFVNQQALLLFDEKSGTRIN